MFIFFFSLFFLSFLGGLVFSWLARKLAQKWQILDYPRKERKIHSQPIPLLGGVAIWLTILLFSSYLAFFTPYLISKYLPLRLLVGLWLAGGLLMLGGFLDDKYDLKPWAQLIWPLAAIILIIFLGLRVKYITNPFGGIIRFAPFSLVSLLFTFFWLLGMSYTTKILDGLDGLVGGISFIGAAIIFFISLFVGPSILPEIGLLSLIFAGALLGFLFFNWHPASLFLGEGGSLFCGFFLGFLAIISGGKIAITLLIFSIPILDLLLVIFQRLKKGESPFSHADRKHLHFRLLKWGLSQPQAVFLLCFLSGLLGILGLFLKSEGRFFALLALSFIMFGAFFLFSRFSTK